MNAAPPNDVLAQALELDAAGFHTVYQQGKRAYWTAWNRIRRTADELRKEYKPGLNVAVVTGQASVRGDRCLVVVDIDVRCKKKAAEAWNAAKRFGCLKVTTITGNGGAHCWFLLPLAELPNCDKLVLAESPDLAGTKREWQIEVLLNRHAVTCPPSIHPDTGKEYRWKDGCIEHIPDAPQALIDAIGAARDDRKTAALAGGAEAVRKALGEAKPPPAAPEAQVGGDGEPALATASRVYPARLDEAAFHGLAGEIVRTIEPHSEADAAALLLQSLVAFGALVGRGPHVRVEGDEHHGNLFIVLVGGTSKARKGTSWGRIREIFSRVANCQKVVSGLSSGEGLKYAVRDAVKRTERDKETGQYVEIEVDSGVPDKRLLVTEPEFSLVLRQSARAGNTLSATIRSAWDTGCLATLTKNDPVIATGAHISIIGHITADELRAELTATDTANGFANRFLFMCARRSKLLPFGGGALTEAVVADLAGRIARAVEHARKLGAVEMTEAARESWSSVYPTLSEGYPGLLGTVTARAEAQCIRLALLYALLDSAEQIDRPHLLAAIAVWERAEGSARYIFGSALGDPVADEILRALRAAGSIGMTRTAIRDLFKRHEKAERIGAALDLLARCRLAVRHDRPAQGGRPAELWTAT